MGTSAADLPSTLESSAPCHDYEKQHVENMTRRRADLDGAATQRADDMAAECRDRLIASMQNIVASTTSDDKNRHGERKLGILLSGGVDSCAMLHAAALSNIQFAAAITVSIVHPKSNPKSRAPDDESYAIEAARLYNEQLLPHGAKMIHKIVRLTPAQLIETYSPPTIKALALWGYMETRNSLIISAALNGASAVGLTDIVTGDNADELFGGSYDCYFSKQYESDLEGWKEKRNSMADLPFVTQKLAKAYDITVHQPFTDQGIFVKWALKETGRNDCISKCEVQNHFEGPYEMQNCGKICLREAFCTIASWRRMDWIFRGSGAEEGNILLDHYTTHLGISTEEFALEQKRYLAMGIKLQSPEHLHNIRTFQEVFGGLNHPTKTRYPEGDPRGCISCRFEIGDEQFCHLCDEYPAQHPTNEKSD